MMILSLQEDLQCRPPSPFLFSVSLYMASICPILFSVSVSLPRALGCLVHWSTDHFRILVSSSSRCPQSFRVVLRTSMTLTNLSLFPSPPCALGCLVYCGWNDKPCENQNIKRTLDDPIHRFSTICSPT